MEILDNFDITYQEVKALIHPKSLRVLEQEYKVIKASNPELRDLTFKSLAINRGFLKGDQTVNDSVFKIKQLEKKYNIKIIAETKDNIELSSNKLINKTIINQFEDFSGKKVSKVMIVPLQTNNSDEEVIDLESIDINHLYNKVIKGGPESEEANIFLDALLVDAVNQHASDIHFIHGDLACWVKYKEFGKFIDKFAVEEEMHDKLIAMIKNRANLDMANRDSAMNGNITKYIQGIKISYRVSTIPQENGIESCVIRVLNKHKGAKKLTEIFPESHPFYKYATMIPKHESGLFLVVGATGEGKTTTLNAFVTAMNRLETPVYTIEDPIEYDIEYVRQFQVDRKKGRDFHTILTAMLRHDPSVIVIGEMQTEEVIRTSLTGAEAGHYIISTLHANDSESAVRRLIDSGASPSILANTLTGVLSQKLVPALCNHCKEIDQHIPEFIVDKYHLDKTAHFYKKSKNGCGMCKHTGYYDRNLLIDSIIFTNHKDNNVVYKQAIESGKRLSDLPGVVSFSRNECIKWLLEDGICDIATVEERSNDSKAS